MTLPAIQKIQVAVRPLAHFAAREAAAAAGAAPINFMAGTLIVGDGNSVVPAISDLVATGSVVREVWRGSAIHSVSQNPNNPRQLDILCIVPAVDTAGHEIGPFWITEFVILDETGTPVLVGTTLAPKLVTANGQPTDLAWVAAVGFSEGAVILTPPSANFTTMLDVELAINAHHPEAVAPLTQSDTVLPNGWLRRVFGLRAASQTATGYGRVATDDEFNAGTAAQDPGVFEFPWPSLQQIRAKFETWRVGSGEGVDIAANRANLKFEGLAEDLALKDADIFARKTEAGHRRFTLGQLAAWINGKINFPGVVHDGSLAGDGRTSALSLNIQHDATLAGSGTADAPLKVAADPEGLGIGAIIYVSYMRNWGGYDGATDLILRADELMSGSWAWGASGVNSRHDGYYEARRGQLAGLWQLQAYLPTGVNTIPTYFGVAKFKRIS